MNLRVISILGRKGSGKTTLSVEFMKRFGGRVIFFSPVADTSFQTGEVWDYDEIVPAMEGMKNGDVLAVKIADVDALDMVCQQAIYDGQGFVIIIDEVDLYAKSKYLETCVHYCRHANLVLIANTRRYVHIPRIFTSQSDLFCIFGTHEPADLEYLRKLGGKEIVETVQGLGPYHYLLMDTSAHGDTGVYITEKG